MFRRRFPQAIAVLLLVLAAWPSSPAGAVGPSPYPYYFRERWARHDTPVWSGKVERTWVWGNDLIHNPATQDVLYEPYAEGFDPSARCKQLPGCGVHDVEGSRPVEYFDKARMEWNYTAISDSSGLWAVTTGLLVEELMTGRLQLGDTEFELREPADIPVAGDPDSTITPSYASLAPLMSYGPIPNGWTITQTLTADGTVTDDRAMTRFGVTAVDVGAPTNHLVASVFWDFMNSSGTLYDLQIQTYYEDKLFENPFYATGYPITEPYWTRAKVGGVVKDVLLQCFERRCLTYTPGNPDGWKVEFGNVGQHYYYWRYGTRPWE